MQGPGAGILLRVFVPLCLCAVVPSSFASISEDFSRYQSILDRKPFGEPLADLAQVTNTPVTPVDLFTRTLKMVAIKLDKSGGLKVGFVNKAAANKGYYLRVGETSNDGIELVDADFKLESALLRKDSQTGWIYMNARESQAGPGLAVAGKPAFKSASSQKLTVSAAYTRKMQQMGEARKQVFEERSAARSKLSEEELEQQMQVSQMDIIRQGLPALPVPLTKEMDDQLVAEGILPPLDSPQVPPDDPIKQ